MTTDKGYFISDSRVSYPDVEAAITAAKRKAKSDGFSRDVTHCNRYLATVTPDGHVDLTWEGSGVVSCKAPERKRGKVNVPGKRLLV